jgi:hypothetical protein
MAAFTDAQGMQKMYPATFEAPSSDELAKLRVGSLVKICADDVERFWVIVTVVDGNSLQGTVDNDLRHTNVHQLKSDDVVSFELRHIYQIFQD